MNEAVPSGIDKGVVNYSARIDGLELDDFEATLPNRFISKVCLRTGEQTTLFIDCYLRRFCTKEEAISITKEEVNLVVSRLSFEFDSPVWDLRCIGWTLPTDESCTRFRVASNLNVRFSIKFEGTVKPSEARVLKFSEWLKQPRSQKDFVLRLYRVAISHEDPIAKFIFLYHILLYLADDNQRRVDSLIRRLYPDVEMTVSPKNRNTYETVFTRLRNELAHRRKGTDLEKTRSEIEQVVSKLKTITKLAISKHFR